MLSPLNESRHGRKPAHGRTAQAPWLAFRAARVPLSYEPKGYDVFRAVSAHGPVDLVAIRGSETLRIDVKTVLGRRRSPPAGGNISYLLVTPDGCELIRPLPPARRA